MDEETLRKLQSALEDEFEVKAINLVHNYEADRFQLFDVTTYIIALVQFISDMGKLNLAILTKFQLWFFMSSCGK